MTVSRRLSIATEGFRGGDGGGDIIVVEAAGSLKLDKSSFEGTLDSSNLSLSLEGGSSKLDLEGSGVNLTFEGSGSDLSS